jgi:hypothetical protein
MGGGDILLLCARYDKIPMSYFRLVGGGGGDKSLKLVEEYNTLLSMRKKMI